MQLVITDNCRAALNFGRFDVAVNAEDEKYEALKSGRCADSSKNRLPLNSACIDDQTASSLKGFFAFKLPQVTRQKERLHGRVAPNT